jgi:hypothetical protein
MTITSVDLTQEGARLSGDGDGSIAPKRKYTAHYRVITDDPTTSPRAIESHFKSDVNLPWYGRSFRWTGATSNDRDPDSVCKGIEISHIPQSAGIFKVEASYEPVDGDGDDKEKPSNDGSNSKDPLEWRDSISVSYTQITVPVMHAVFQGFTRGDDGNEPFRGTSLLQVGRTYVPQASNLVPFVPLPEMEVDIKVIRITRNIPIFISNQYDKWLGTVNTDPVTIARDELNIIVSIEPLQGRLKQISAQTEFANGVSYVRREVEIWVNPRGWRGRLADMGMGCGPRLPGESGYVSPGELDAIPANRDLVEQGVFKDDDDYPIGQPVPLNGFGKPLRGELKRQGEVWLNWSYYPEVAWGWIAKEF